MRAVLYKTNKPKSIYQDFGLFILYNRAYGMPTKEQEIKTYSKPLGRPPKQQPPPDFGRDGKGRQREKRSRMFVSTLAREYIVPTT